jgi:uncharacterized protein YprB with RNaseH-like and TPR domain
MARCTIPAPDLAAALGGRCIQPDLVVIEQVVNGAPWDFVPHDLHTHLQLIYGVGPWWEALLQEMGFRTLQDLLAHPRFGPDAAICLDALARRDARALKARGAPVERLMRLFALKELAFLDIETMGLSFGQEIVVIGVLRYGDGRWVLRQLALLALSCQTPLLESGLLLLDGAAACVTYNGSAFDIPFMRAAMQFHDVETGRLDRLFNADLMYPMRRRYREELPDCRLTTVAAEVLGMRRLDDIPGELIPIEYGRFLKSHDPAVLRRILDHNRDDLLALREIARHAVGAGSSDAVACRPGHNDR